MTIIVFFLVASGSSFLSYSLGLSDGLRVIENADDSHEQQILKRNELSKISMSLGLAQFVIAVLIFMFL